MTEVKTRRPRVSRSAVSRESSTRRKPWRPPALLETPEPPPGYKYRWLRAEMLGQEDRGNMSKRSREGFELVHPDEVAGADLPTMTMKGGHAGVVGVGGLVLAKIPLETVEERTRYYEGQTRQQMQAIDNEVRKESHPAMPIGAPQRESRTTFGNPENKPSLDDA